MAGPPSSLLAGFAGLATGLSDWEEKQYQRSRQKAQDAAQEIVQKAQIDHAKVMEGIDQAHQRQITKQFDDAEADRKERMRLEGLRDNAKTDADRQKYSLQLLTLGMHSSAPNSGSFGQNMDLAELFRQQFASGTRQPGGAPPSGPQPGGGMPAAAPGQPPPNPITQAAGMPQAPPAMSGIGHQVSPIQTPQINYQPQAGQQPMPPGGAQNPLLGALQGAPGATGLYQNDPNSPNALKATKNAAEIAAKAATTAKTEEQTKILTDEEIIKKADAETEKALRNGKITQQSANARRTAAETLLAAARVNQAKAQTLLIKSQTSLTDSKAKTEAITLKLKASELAINNWKIRNPGATKADKDLAGEYDKWKTGDTAAIKEQANLLKRIDEGYGTVQAYQDVIDRGKPTPPTDATDKAAMQLYKTQQDHFNTANALIGSVKALIGHDEILNEELEAQQASSKTMLDHLGFKMTTNGKEDPARTKAVLAAAAAEATKKADEAARLKKLHDKSLHKKQDVAPGGVGPGTVTPMKRPPGTSDAEWQYMLKHPQSFGN